MRKCSRRGIERRLLVLAELVEFDSAHGGFKRVHVRVLGTRQSEVDVGLV
jgi:hypothetical protein